MKKIISSLGVALACFSFAHTANAQANMPFEYSTAASPKWYSIKSAMVESDGSAGYATGKVFQTKGMEDGVTYADFVGLSSQLFRFEKIGEQDSFKIINRKFPDGCLLSKGPVRSVDKIYGAEAGNAEYLAWALETLADEGKGVQYRIVADDQMLDTAGDDATGKIVPQILHAQKTGTVIVSWDAGYNSGSAWLFQAADSEAFAGAFEALIGEIEALTNLANGNTGSGIGQYPEDLLVNLMETYAKLSDIIPAELSDSELIELCDNTYLEVTEFKNSRGQVQPYLPLPSTASEPIWYVLRSEATDDRKGRIVAKAALAPDRVLWADALFNSSDNKHFWRVEKEGDYYTLINKDGGAIQGSMLGSNFATTINQDTTCFDFKIVSPDPYNEKMDPKLVGLVNKENKPFHQGNSGYNWKVISYGLEDAGSKFSFTLADDLVSDPILFSTEEAPVWYYIKGKRQADALTNQRPYLTAYSADVDTVYTKTNSTTGVESHFRYSTFGRPESILLAAGDSAQWRFEEVMINETSTEDPTVEISVKKTLIINKLTGKCLNAYNHGQSHPTRFVDKQATGDTVFPYWDAVDKTMNMWNFRSRQVTDGAAAVTYMNFDNSPGLTIYNVEGDAGSNFWLEKVERWVVSTPERPTDNIKIYVTDGKIMVSGTDAKPSVFSITGASVDANKKLSQGVYVVKVDGKSAKVVVTK